jgi:hypothetical protein
MEPGKKKAAIETRRNKETCRYKVSRFFNLPHIALRCCVKDRQKSSSETMKTKLGKKQVLSCEAELSSALSFGGKKDFGLTIADSCISLNYLL